MADKTIGNLYTDNPVAQPSRDMLFELEEPGSNPLGGATTHGAVVGGLADSVLTVSGVAANHDVLPTHAGLYIRFTGTGAKTATFDDMAGFTSGLEFHIANRAASGNLTLAPTSNMILNAPKGGTLVLEPDDTVTVKFVDVDEADVMGSTENA